MVMSVNTNISSLNAQKNLATSQNKLATAIERLSSGMRINSAKDDAAGLAISTRFTTQINGLNQAVSNANDGISLAQTTESALNEVTNNMQRIRTLAVQSANATNSDSDRAALDAEVQQRLAEITRISQQTTFNGRHVLDGSFGSAAFQIGANVGETISVDLSQGSGSRDIGKIATSSSGDVSGKFAAPAGITLGAGDLTIGATDITGNFTTSQGLVDAINGASIAGVTASLSGGEVTLTNTSASTVTVTGARHDDLFGAGATSLADGSGTPTTAATTGAAAAVATPASAGLSLAAGELTIQSGTGSVVDLQGDYQDAQALVAAINGKGITGVSAYFSSDTGAIHLNSQEALTVDGTKAGAGELGFSGAGTTIAVDQSKSLADSNVKTVTGANDTISRIDSALGTISGMRSDLGAVQNRFDSTIANLQTISQNLSASRSQIQDADFAAETANMTSANILQQAGVSVLAQANASTQGVLQLLQ